MTIPKSAKSVVFRVGGGGELFHRNGKTKTIRSNNVIIVEIN